MDAPPRSALVLDEEPHISKLVALALRANGFTVHTFLDAAEALRRLPSLRFDIAFIGLSLHSLGGLEVVRQVQRVHPESEVVVMSSGAPPPTESGALCLQKPFDLSELLPLALRRPRPASTAEGRGNENSI